MEKLFRLFLVIIVISSCSKNKGDTNNSSGVLRPDTLSAGWSKSSPLPPENFKDIYFTDNATGYAVSNNGIYKSTNGGTDWTKVHPAINMTNIGAGSNDHVCFVDGAFLVLVTQDAGNSFLNASYPYPGGGTIGFFDCFFSGANTCYFSSNQYTWKSVDGGLSIDTSYRFPKSSSTSSLFFLNDLEGWIIRQDGLYQTTNGGIAWDTLTPLTNGYGSVQFLDINNGYFSNYGTINKTTDGGVTWLPVFESPFQAYADIDFVSVNEGYFSSGNRIYKTTDAGGTWTPVAALGNEFFSEIHFTDANHGWACTSDGVLLTFNQ